MRVYHNRPRRYPSQHTSRIPQVSSFSNAADSRAAREAGALARFADRLARALTLPLLLPAPLALPPARFVSGVALTDALSSHARRRRRRRWRRRRRRRRRRWYGGRRRGRRREGVPLSQAATAGAAHHVGAEVSVVIAAAVLRVCGIVRASIPERISGAVVHVRARWR